jgi:hypothetical protein
MALEIHEDNKVNCRHPFFAPVPIKLHRYPLQKLFTNFHFIEALFTKSEIFGMNSEACLICCTYLPKSLHVERRGRMVS